MPRPLSLPTRSRPAFLALFFPALLTLAALLGTGGARADDASEVREMAARGELASALRRVEQAVAAHPRDAQLRFLHGVMLMDNQRDEAALALFTQMSQEFPELPDPYNNMALLLARAGRVEAALAAVQEALRVEPNHRTALSNLGQLHLMLAIKAWQGLARSGPIDPALQRRLDGARALLASPTLLPR